MSRPCPWWVLHGARSCLSSIRIGLSHRCVTGLASLSHDLCLLVLLSAIMSCRSPRPSFDAWGCISTLSLAVDLLTECMHVMLLYVMNSMVLTSGEVTGLSQDRASKQDAVAGKHRSKCCDELIPQ